MVSQECADQEGLKSRAPLYPLSAAPMWQRRTRSWSPPLQEVGLPDVDGDDSDDPNQVLFDKCRFPRLPGDLLDCALGDEPWQDVKAEDGKVARVVGEASALKRLFSLPLRSAGESVCIHRLGNCLVVLDGSEEPLDDDSPEHRHGEMHSTAPPLTCSPRTASRCQVLLEGDMIRVYPRIETAEPVDVKAPSVTTAPVAASCEWRVREGLSLLAVTPGLADPGRSPSAGGTCDLADIRSTPPRLFTRGYVGRHAPAEGLDILQAQRPSLPAYHRNVTEKYVAVMAIPLSDTVETSTLVDAWFSCCLNGSPSLLCFFVDGEGICRGCRFVAAGDIASLGQLAEAYRGDQRPLMDLDPRDRRARGPEDLERGAAFDPNALREVSHRLLEALLERLPDCEESCQDCGLVLASPFGIRLLKACSPSDDDEPEIENSPVARTGPLALHSGEVHHEAGILSSSLLGKEPAVGSDCRIGAAAGAAARRACVTQALLMYHAAVRLAQGDWKKDPSAAQSLSIGAQYREKDVPIGSRWTAKSCRHPFRVRQMMFRALQALRTAASIGGPDGGTGYPTGQTAAEASAATQVPQETPPPACETAIGEASSEEDPAVGKTPRVAPEPAGRFLLLSASACEFLADSFLAEDSREGENDSLDMTRYLTALRHLKRSLRYLRDYIGCSPIACDDSRREAGISNFAQSVSRLEERVIAKRINVHLSLARLRQRQPWRNMARPAGAPPLRCCGSALIELEDAEALVSQPSRVTQAPRPPGPYESFLLASISKWRADLLYELATLAMPSALCGRANASGIGAGSTPDARLTEYLDEQQSETHGEHPANAGSSANTRNPLPVQCERWLQSTISLTLRGLHQLSALPSEVAEELQAQARALLARAYSDLGHIYASTGRYTKAMTHAKQGIELFNATKDKLHASKLQLWLCRLQLRLALQVPTAAPSTAGPSCGLAQGEDFLLLRGLSAADPGGREEAACSQVVASLQRVVKSLDEENSDERATRSEGQSLLGLVLLRQGLARLARIAPFCAVCRLCEEDRALPTVLELLQGVEPCTKSTFESVREALEMLLQAASAFRQGEERELSGIAHACLAVSYFCGRASDVRHWQRLSSTHCQHALDALQLTSSGQPTPARPGAGAGLVQELRLALQILEMKALQSGGTTTRRGTPPGGNTSTAHTAKATASDARAAVVLCDVALHLQARQARNLGLQARVRDEASHMAPDTDQVETQHRARHAGSSCGATETPAEASQLRVLTRSSEKQLPPFLSYVRQELGDILLRLLKSTDEQFSERLSRQKLKALYCSLLTAWHANAADEEDVLRTIRSHVEGLPVAADE